MAVGLTAQNFQGSNLLKCLQLLPLTAVKKINHSNVFCDEIQ